MLKVNISKRQKEDAELGQVRYNERMVVLIVKASNGHKDQYDAIVLRMLNDAGGSFYRNSIGQEAGMIEQVYPHVAKAELNVYTDQ